eukprot:CAMPEP_0119071976 /NCGR_PEP_ID=MMETSP1178-20130426/56271_1 /TAXON_ID=33656 /ORGANISM="unid sp, Strain CCMP2000" /LENGTH=256 /DNA_ID=CAMNT_0007053949 /DNA_START=23 /DNA_END=793 /DNA_ORIENTATION=+
MPEASLEKEFSQVGTMARPAGVPGGLGSSNLGSEYYGKMLKKGTDRGAHALQTASPYAERAEPGWAPKEATVRPSWSDKGAGTVSAGCIDNTYMPAPLKNKWGKQREMSAQEVVVLPHKQATDLLAVTLGTQMPLPKETIEDMPSVREPYSKTIPLFHPIDPMRAEAGFIRGPNIIPGAAPPPISPLHNAPPIQMVPEDWKLRKLEYEKEQKGLGRIPVLKKVSDEATRGAVGPHASFLRKPAGLPGGLSLIPVKP